MKHTLILGATKEGMRAAMEALGAEMEEKKCSMRSRMEFEIAFEELFINIVHYAYQGEKGKVRLTYEFFSKDKENWSLRVELIDRGIAYNPLDKEDPDITLSAKQRKIGGLGIFMAKSLLDMIAYERVENENRLTFEKKLHIV